MILYNSFEDNFENSGLGILVEATNAYITRKINSTYILEFNYPKNGRLIEYIMEDNIVKADGQLFRISYINKKSKESWKITANHIAYDLNDNFLEDVAPTDQNGVGALNWILDRANFTHRFKAISNVKTIASARYVRKNLLSCILSEDNALIKRWGGEIDFDNFTIKFFEKLGEDRGLKLSLEKNISGIEVTINKENLATRLMPVGSDGILLPEKYIDSTLISNYPHPIVRTIEVNSAKIDEEMTEDEAYNLMRNTCINAFENGIDIPTVNLKIDFVTLQNTIEYSKFKNLETVFLGDTVSCFIKEYGITTKLRVIGLKKNVLKGTYEKLELGEPLNNFSKQQISITDKIKKIENESSDIVDIAKLNASEMIKNALGGYIYKTNNELFIMDTDDINTAEKVWRWNLNGLGYSKTGVNGSYETAITQDGKIVADFITAGTLSANLIRGGILKLGSNLNENGKLELYDENNRLVGLLDKNGLTFNRNDGGYIRINAENGLVGYNQSGSKTFWGDQNQFYSKNFMSYGCYNVADVGKLTYVDTPENFGVGIVQCDVYKTIAKVNIENYIYSNGYMNADLNKSKIYVDDNAILTLEFTDIYDHPRYQRFYNQIVVKVNGVEVISEEKLNYLSKENTKLTYNFNANSENVLIEIYGEYNYQNIYD